MSTAASTASRRRPWTLERTLFAMAGSVTLAGVALGVLVSPWFLLLPVVTGLSQWSYVLAGDCPASLALKRLTGLRGCGR
ncbi:MAG TPA: hypothetical protein VFG74_12525 [Miltoncostaeaceae bacterium]|nr:hypothetical protein [Miltoncostaeaceae bacterium]